MGKTVKTTDSFHLSLQKFGIALVYLTTLCGEHCFRKLANLQPSFEMLSIKFD